MLETLGIILAAMLAIVGVGAILLGYVLWSRKRRNDAAFEAAAEADQQRAGGGGGPKPVK